MKTRFNQLIYLLIPCLLPLLLGICIVFLMPDYGTAQEQTAYILDEYPDAQILEERSFEKYKIFPFRTEDSVGYGLFQKVLGNWIFDHAEVSSSGPAVGHFYMYETMYHVIVFHADNVHSVSISYKNPVNGNFVEEKVIQTNGSPMVIVPSADDDFIIEQLVLMDSLGNPIE